MVAVVGISDGKHSIEVDSVRIINKKQSPATVNVAQNAPPNQTSKTSNGQTVSKSRVTQSADEVKPSVFEQAIMDTAAQGRQLQAEKEAAARTPQDETMERVLAEMNASKRGQGNNPSVSSADTSPYTGEAMGAPAAQVSTQDTTVKTDTAEQTSTPAAPQGEKPADAVYFGEKSGVVREGQYGANLKNMNLSRRTERVLDAVAKVAGVQVRVVDRITDADGNEVNARYANGVIEISQTCGSPVRTAFSHEIVHRIRETAPAEYRALEDFVRSHMNAATIGALERMYGKRYAANEISEEIVADAVGTILSDRAVMEQFVQDNRSAGQKLLDVVHDMVAAVKRALNGQNQSISREQMAAYSELLSDLEGFETALKDSLQAIPQEGQKNTTREGGEWKYSKAWEILELEDVDWMGNHTSVKAQLKKHAAEINEMNPVAEVWYEELAQKEIEDMIMEVLPEIGGGRISKNGVVFDIDRPGAKSVASHADKDREASAAALAMPFIAKYGKLVSGHKNHEDLGFPTLTYAAPIVINGVRVNAGVVIQFTSKGRPRAVNVGLSDGGSFKMKETPKGTGNRVIRLRAGQGTSLPTEGVSNWTIAQEGGKSKHKNSAKFSDSDWSEAAEAARDAVSERDQADRLAQGNALRREKTRLEDVDHQKKLLESGGTVKVDGDIKTVQGNLGHATAAFTLDVYGHVTDQMKQASAARMEGYIKDVLSL